MGGAEQLQSWFEGLDHFLGSNETCHKILLLRSVDVCSQSLLPPRNSKSILYLPAALRRDPWSNTPPRIAAQPHSQEVKSLDNVSTFLRR